jgi:hypothetical protein
MKMILLAKYKIGCFNIGPAGLSSGTECLALTAVFVGIFLIKIFFLFIYLFFLIRLTVTDSTLSWP